LALGDALQNCLRFSFLPLLLSPTPESCMREAWPKALDALRLLSER
jgi:hypothetical protein